MKLLREAVIWRKPGGLERILHGLLNWDLAQLTGARYVLEGDPFAAMEYRVATVEELRARFIDLTERPPKELVEFLVRGAWVENTLVAWRELLFLCLINGESEWAVFMWSPALGELVNTEVISAEWVFPEEDLTPLAELRMWSWLMAGLDPETGKPFYGSARERMAELSGRISRYVELPLEPVAARD